MPGSEITISRTEFKEYLEKARSEGYADKKPEDVVRRAKEAAEFHETEALLRKGKPTPGARRRKRVGDLKRALRDFPGHNADAKARDAEWLGMSVADFPVDHVAGILKRRKWSAQKRDEKAGIAKPRPVRVDDMARVKSVASKLKARALARPTDTRCLLMLIKDEFDAIAKTYIRLLDLRKELGRNPSPNEFAASIGGKCNRMWAIDRLMLLGILEESDGPFHGVTI